MPINDFETLPELYILQPDGTKTKLGKIKEAEFVDEASSYDAWDDCITYALKEREYTFKVNWNPSIDTLYLLIYGRLPFNNRRRMHGWPLRRTVHSKNRRRK